MQTNGFLLNFGLNVRLLCLLLQPVTDFLAFSSQIGVINPNCTSASSRRRSPCVR